MSSSWGAWTTTPTSTLPCTSSRTTWPLVRDRRPELRLVIVGAQPPKQVLRVARAGYVVTGTVDDVRPYYHSALVSVVPLRVGGGTRLKVLEAMAAGTPVVSTSLGAEGLAVTHGKDILIADTPHAMADAVVSMQAESPQWQELVANARRAGAGEVRLERGGRGTAAPARRAGRDGGGMPQSLETKPATRAGRFA